MANQNFAKTVGFHSAGHILYSHLFRTLATLASLNKHYAFD